MDTKITTFSDLGIPEDILKALQDKGYEYPTRVQEEAIPPMMQGRDIIAKAPTGTGKTFAFGIPMITHIDKDSDDLQALVLAPTRELAIQICDELRSLLTHTQGIRVAVVYGGAKMDPQIRQLQNIGNYAARKSQQLLSIAHMHYRYVDHAAAELFNNHSDQEIRLEIHEGIRNQVISMVEDRACDGKCEKIAQAISCVAITFRDKKGEDGEGETARNSPVEVIGVEEYGVMVDGHQDHRDDFKKIS